VVDTPPTSEEVSSALVPLPATIMPDSLSLNLAYVTPSQTVAISNETSIPLVWSHRREFRQFSGV
jgi:hypothetical protein